MVGFDLKEQVATQVHMAMVPHVATKIEPAINKAEASIRVVMAEDYSYDRTPELEQNMRQMISAVRGLPDALEEAVRHGGPAGLEDAKEFENVALATDKVLTTLEDMEVRAAQRVSYSAETAAREAMSAVGEMLLTVSPDVIMQVIIPALKERSSA